MTGSEDRLFTLTVVIPSYNSQDYMRRAIDSILTSGFEDVEIIIVDDGSMDRTGAIADEYASRFPAAISAIHQENKGHGGAVNTGIANARGVYVKVLDSDDWFDPQAFTTLMATLRFFVSKEKPIDLVITNYVYEKVGARHKKVMRYRGVFPPDRPFTWEDMGRFGLTRYLLMHSMVFRREVLLASGMVLPEHTFYVDNLFVSVPLPYAQSLYYLDVNLYRYFIGRSDQSVNESVMIKRIDQQLRVNRLMLDNMVSIRPESPKLREVMLHHFEIITAISSILLIIRGDEDAFALKDELWEDIRGKDIHLYRVMRRRLLGMVINFSGALGHLISSMAYNVAQRIFGFN